MIFIDFSEYMMIAFLAHWALPPPDSEWGLSGDGTHENKLIFIGYYLTFNILFPSISIARVYLLAKWAVQELILVSKA